MSISSFLCIFHFFLKHLLESIVLICVKITSEIIGFHQRVFQKLILCIWWYRLWFFRFSFKVIGAIKTIFHRVCKMTTGLRKSFFQSVSCHTFIHSLHNQISHFLTWIECFLSTFCLSLFHWSKFLMYAMQ